MKFLLLLPLLAPPMASQGVSPKSLQEIPLDRVVFIVNEDIVTQRGYQRQLQTILQQSPPQTEDDRRRINALLQQRLLEQFAGQQGGETLGYDPTFVERYVRDYEKRFIEQIGGLDAMAQYMADRNLSLADLRSELRTNVYRDLWEESVTGRGVAAKNRLTVDRWVRPGLIGLQHELAVATPGGAEALGGTPARVVLQILEIEPSRVGGASAVSQAAQNILKRIRAGEDAEELGRQFAAEGTLLGARPALEEQALESVDPVLGRAVRAGREGDWLSPISPASGSGRWRLVRIVQRTPASLPPFSDRRLQVRLREAIQDSLDQQRLLKARSEQYAGSFIWPKAPQQQSAAQPGS